VLGRRNSAETKSTAVRQKQPVKIIDEGQAFCDTVLEYLTDNSDFLVVGELIIVRFYRTLLKRLLLFVSRI
jgi:hypothetical protein